MGVIKQLLLDLEGRFGEDQAKEICDFVLSSKMGVESLKYLCPPVNIGRNKTMKEIEFDIEVHGVALSVRAKVSSDYGDEWEVDELSVYAKDSAIDITDVIDSMIEDTIVSAIPEHISGGPDGPDYEPEEPEV